MTELPPWLKLLVSQRWAALGTTDDDSRPNVSSVAYCTTSAPRGGLLLHLSQLAAHTGYLQSRPHISILISEPDNGEGDPQTLQRLSLSGEAAVISDKSESFQEASRTYMDKFPDSEMRFGLGDFHLFHFQPERGNFIGGFGAAGRIAGQKIVESLQSQSFA